MLMFYIRIIISSYPVFFLALFLSELEQPGKRNGNGGGPSKNNRAFANSAFVLPVPLNVLTPHLCLILSALVF